MLNLTKNLIDLSGINISCAAIENTIIKKGILAEIIAKAMADAIIVGGIVFFSTLASIGIQNMNENLYTALLSSSIASGLSFFTEIRKTKNKIWIHKNHESRF